jgi:hypothetical protein
MGIDTPPCKILTAYDGVAYREGCLYRHLCDTHYMTHTHTHTHIYIHRSHQGGVCVDSGSLMSLMVDKFPAATEKGEEGVAA